MRLSLSTPLEPTMEQAARLAELRASVLLLHQRVQTYLNAGGQLSWASALLGGDESGPEALAAPVLPLRIGQLLDVFHGLRPQLPWCHVAPQATYDAVLRSAMQDPTAPCPLHLDDAVQLIDPVTVLIAPLGREARVLGQPYLLPGAFWGALVRDARQRHARLEARRQTEEDLWLAGDVEAGRRLLGLYGRSVVARPALPLPTLIQAATFRRRETTLEQRPDGWWVTWTFEADPDVLPWPRVHDAVGCDPGQRFWAVLASAQQSRFIAAPRSPWQVPSLHPSRGWMPVPVDLRRARAELGYRMAEAARPEREALLDLLLSYDVVGVENVDWQALQQRRFAFAEYATATGLRAVLDTLAELGPQVGCRVIRTPSRLSSRICSSCGRVAPGRGYGHRMYRCPRCGLTVDRDINAARNHRQAALEAVGS